MCSEVSESVRKCAQVCKSVEKCVKLGIVALLNLKCLKSNA